MYSKIKRQKFSCQHWDTYTAYYRRYFIFRKVFGIACEDCDVWISLEGSDF